MPSVPFAALVQPLGHLFKRLATVSPKEAKVTIGVDIGSSSVKVVALGPRKGSSARPIIAQNLVVLTPDQEADASDAVKRALETLHLPIRTVNIGVSGQWVIMRVVEMPTMKPAEMKQAMPFEAQRYLPFNIQDVVIDGEVLGPADANKTWVLIVACKKELLERRIDWVKCAGFEVALIDVDALALANSVLAQANGQQPEGMRAALNVGAQLSNLVIFQGANPYLVRDIPWGAEKLCRSVGEQTGMDAQAVKGQLMKGESSETLLNAIKTATETLVTEVQLSFDYFENRFGHPPETILVTGGLGQSPLFIEALKTHLTRGVNAWTPVQGLSGQFAVAYGLALRTE